MVRRKGQISHTKHIRIQMDVDVNMSEYLLQVNISNITLLGLETNLRKSGKEVHGYSCEVGAQEQGAYLTKNQGIHKTGRNT